ncbi:SRA stem-loop-interacting RNA-binding protein, mitochondrial [Holothuria leucospilota]|uniref:SRA stem-loop-interacting RNA-binding protein, mitochondrial n=1 Tax=Holothuria leucospilota TaxID=206669 RepID=A0A9Q1CFE6_HOLLE|nr:SRA stem-loop-interacting RNA-binding protein, mitochondrial [Holothuria leucospilota]
MAAANGRKVFDLVVTRLPWTIGTNELREYFTQFGTVKACKVAFDQSTGFSKGFGFVGFANPASAQTALRKGFHVMDGQKVQVQIKKNGENSLGTRQLRITELLETENT